MRMRLGEKDSKREGPTRAHIIKVVKLMAQPNLKTFYHAWAWPNQTQQLFLHLRNITIFYVL
ncbi:hypothetical protein IC582_008818 [Cucumis melo]